MTIITNYRNEIDQFAGPARRRQVTNMFRFAAAAGADDAGDPGAVTGLNDILGQQATAPASTTVVAVPSNVSTEDHQNLQYVQLLDSYVSVYSAQLLYKQQPSGWNIADPAGAAAFVKALANAKFRILTQGLAGVLSLDNSTTATFDKSTTSADLHMEFINSMFGSFGFPDSTMKELDGVLTNVASALSSLQMSWSDSSQTVDHLLSFYYFEPVQGLPDEKIAKMRLFYLHIDQSSWTASLGKSSIEQFRFHMLYDDFQFDMSPAQMALDAAKIQGFITTATDKSYDAIMKLLKQDAVTGDVSG